MTYNRRRNIKRGGVAVATFVALLAVCAAYNWRDPGVFVESLWEVGGLRLYGRVVDESGAPLDGVTIKFKVAKPNPFLLIGYQRSSLGRIESSQTDADGRFAIQNRWGHRLDLYQFEKAGYEDSKRAKRYPRRPTEVAAATAGTSPDNPLTFILPRVKKNDEREHPALSRPSR